MSEFTCLFKKIDETNESIVLYMKELEMELMKVQQELKYKEHLLGEKSKEITDYELENKRLKLEIIRLKRLLYPQQTLSPPSPDNCRSKKKPSYKRRKRRMLKQKKAKSCDDEPTPKVTITQSKKSNHQRRRTENTHQRRETEESQLPINQFTLHLLHRPQMPYLASTVSSSAASSCSNLSAQAVQLQLPTFPSLGKGPLPPLPSLNKFNPKDSNPPPSRPSAAAQVLSPIAEIMDEDRSQMNKFLSSPLNGAMLSLSTTSSAPMTSRHLIKISDDNFNIENEWGYCMASIDQEVVVNELDMDDLTSDDESATSIDTEMILEKNLAAREHLLSSDDECDPLPMSLTKQSEDPISYMSNNTQIWNDLNVTDNMRYPKSFSPTFGKVGCLMELDAAKASPRYNVLSSETLNGCDGVVKAPFTLYQTKASMCSM